MKVLTSLGHAFTVMVRPIHGFWEMKYEKKGTLKAAFILAFIAICVFLFSVQYQAFIFTTFNPFEFNVIRKLAGTIVPFILWCAANWCVTTIMDGEGNLRHIFMATCYALVPYILFTLIATILSYGLLESEGVFMGYLLTLGLGWSFLLLFCGNMVIHQYTVTKTIWTFVLSVAGMILIMFIAILFSSIFDKIYNFLLGFYNEIKLRL